MLRNLIPLIPFRLFIVIWLIGETLAARLEERDARGPRSRRSA